MNLWFILNRSGGMSIACDDLGIILNSTLIPIIFGMTMLNIQPV
jgi:hypothetical protein